MNSTSQNSLQRQVFQSKYTAREQHHEQIGSNRKTWIQKNQYYYNEIYKHLNFIIPKNSSVLNIRCQTGHFLNAIQPKRGVGVEISESLVKTAQDEYPEYEFIYWDQSCNELDLGETFDFIVFNDLFDSIDLLQDFKQIKKHCHESTRIIISNYNFFWQPALALGSKLGARMPYLQPNWLTLHDIDVFLKLADLKKVKVHHGFIFPYSIPFLSNFLNDYLAKAPLINQLCLNQMIIARSPCEKGDNDQPSVSIIIPCKNEKDNIEQAVLRIPQMGSDTEIIFCNDQSTDGTEEEIIRVQQAYPQKNIRLVQGPGICKSENVWTGFDAAQNDILMILDGDLTVVPEELPHFYKALIQGKGEFINGSRLVYPMEKKAMKINNFLGNHFYSILFSYILGSRIKDTLCGTKVFWRKDWQKIKEMAGRWGTKDLWGDYDLIFGAAKLNLEIQDLPVHYCDRIYGVTKMTRVFANGLRMLRICKFAWQVLRLHRKKI